MVLESIPELSVRALPHNHIVCEREREREREGERERPVRIGKDCEMVVKFMHLLR